MGKRKTMPFEVWIYVHERAEGACEAMIPRVCVGAAQHFHHRKMRSQGGEHTVENGLRICHACHSFIHANPAWSYERGLLIRGRDEVTWPPKYYRGVYRKEEDDGSNQDN